MVVGGGCLNVTVTDSEERPDDRSATTRRATGDQLRALGHPIRVRILEALANGPGTASTLARELGESSGATSYHLRALGRAGLVEEDATQPNRRERWWRRREGWLVIPTGSTDPDERAAESRLRAFFVERDAEAVARFVARADELDASWREAAFIGSWNVDLTPAEVEALAERVVAEILAAGRKPRRGPGRSRIVVSFKAVPWLDESSEA